MSANDRSAALAEAHRQCLLADSHSRLDVVMGWRGRLPELEWWRLLGREWTGCDGLGDWRAALGELLALAPREHLDAMMTAEEQAALAALPEGFWVYRGCYANNLHGLSWTLDEGVASRFPFFRRFRQPGQPLLATGQVERSRCVLLLDRGEREIVSPSVVRITTQALQEPADVER